MLLKILAKFCGNSQLYELSVKEKLSRRNIVFLHIPKTGGSSFWHSFSEALNSNAELMYGVDDAHSEAINRFNDVTKSLIVLRDIKTTYINLRLNRLIIHYHNCYGDITSILSNPLFIVLTRKPSMRLKSAFRHWRSENHQAPWEDFFLNSHYSKGINYYFAGCLGYDISPLSHPDGYIVDFIENNVHFISLEDYTQRTSVVKIIEKILGIPEIKVIHYNGNITEQSYNEELDFLLINDDGFSRQWKSHLSVEEAWHKKLSLNI
jgi:hypothetical protein